VFFIINASGGRADKCLYARLIGKASGGLFFIFYHLCSVLINIHTHRPEFSDGILAVENVYFGQRNTPESPQQSVGIHPWYFQSEQLDAARAWLLDAAVRPETVAIGEAGLDKAIERPLADQIAAFKICVEISEAVQKPLILHCVRAFSEIISLKKAWKPEQAWIFHGFDKHPQTAAMVLRAGCYLSFGAALMRQNSAAAASLRATPPDRFFLETDTDAIALQEVYARVAQIMGISPEALEKQMEHNWARVFAAGEYCD
jgi:TatD DNase family protein